MQHRHDGCSTGTMAAATPVTVSDNAHAEDLTGMGNPGRCCTLPYRARTTPMASIPDRKAHRPDGMCRLRRLFSWPWSSQSGPPSRNLQFQLGRSKPLHPIGRAQRTHNGTASDGLHVGVVFGEPCSQAWPDVVWDGRQVGFADWYIEGFALLATCPCIGWFVLNTHRTVSPRIFGCRAQLGMHKMPTPTGPRLGSPHTIRSKCRILPSNAISQAARCA